MLLLADHIQQCLGTTPGAVLKGPCGVVNGTLDSCMQSMHYSPLDYFSGSLKNTLIYLKPILMCLKQRC